MSVTLSLRRLTQSLTSTMMMMTMMMPVPKKSSLLHLFHVNCHVDVVFVAVVAVIAVVVVAFVSVVLAFIDLT